MKKLIILVGFMGVGKTTVGRALAAKRQVDFIDLDEEIEFSTGCSINQIFSQRGEECFRSLETQALAALDDNRPAVISTGGGIVARSENWELMHSKGKVFYLHAEWSTLVSRLTDTSQRPLADNCAEEKLMHLWQTRLPLYRQADVVINTDGLTVDEVVAEILVNV